MNDDKDLLTPGELRARLKLKPSTFHRHMRAGQFKRYEVKHAIGVRRYSARLVDALLDGKTVTFYGRRVSA